MSQKNKITEDELKGLSALVRDSVVHTSDLAEELNRRIVEPPGIPSTPVQRLINTISGMVYSIVRSSANLAGRGVEKSVDKLHLSFETRLSAAHKEAVQAVMNGILGDYLVEKKNPLAVYMEFRYAGKSFDTEPEAIRQTYPELNGNIILYVHGLCMSDNNWSRDNESQPELLAEKLNMTPVYLHYNSGLHISENGKQLNVKLGELVKAWPVPVEKLILITHSMGGLITRSACYYASDEQEQEPWLQLLDKVVFLGTPHHGSPLERMGNYVDYFLDATPFTRPFSRIGKMRSPGITDLRFGTITESDWKTHDRFEKRKDERLHIPLAENAEYYAVAALTGRKEDALKSRLLGDGLVPQDSALGIHDDPAKSLTFLPGHTRTFRNVSHFELLYNKRVWKQLELWLRP
ncbi:MAG: GPI inositol-deacylase [Balneolia bacterium]|nr:GPI inositol-deacylase [Balneolia bacterium]